MSGWQLSIRSVLTAPAGGSLSVWEVQPNSAHILALYMALVVKNPPANARDVTDVGLIPGLGRLPGEGNSNPFQHSCLENPMDRGACWATVHRVTQSLTWLKLLSRQAAFHYVNRVKLFWRRLYLEARQSAFQSTLCAIKTMPYQAYYYTTVFCSNILWAFTYIGAHSMTTFFLTTAFTFYNMDAP